MNTAARVLPGAEAFRFDGGPLGAVLIHGFTGCPASMRPMGEWLSQHGVAVIGPRLPGHGTRWEDLGSVTWQDWEREADQAIEELATTCSDVIVVGLSMGGALAVHEAVKHQDTLRGIAIINGYVNDPRLAAAPIGRLFARSRKGVGNDIKKPGHDEICYDRLPMKILPSLNKLLKTSVSELSSLRLPLLVFSSVEDHIVKPANSKLIMERAGSKQKELVTLTNSYHVATLDYDAEFIFQRILDFLKANAAAAA